MSKTLNTRVIQKHDIEANWILAENFIPKNGEIIIYDADQNNPQPRIKIGNGTTNVNQLPFIEQIIDVLELPVSNIIENFTYRTLKGQFVYKTFLRNDSTCYIVNWDTTPSTPGEDVFIESSEGISLVAYYNMKDNKVYGYFTDNVKTLLKARVDASDQSDFLKIIAKGIIDRLSTGWNTLNSIFKNTEAYTGISYGDVIISRAQATEENKVYLYLTYNTFIYRNNNWITLENEILKGSGLGAEIFNSTVNTANGPGSHAEGYKTKATAAQAHAEGNTTTASGYASHTEGEGTVASGPESHAEGGGSIASAWCSHAEGHLTEAEKSHAHAEGSATKARGEASHAEGIETVAQGDASHTEGHTTIAEGKYSHAEGYNTQALSDYAHAEGLYTEAAELASHAEGEKTKAIGSFSHAEGSMTQAIGTQSHAEGSATEATGSSSHAEGSSTKAIGKSSHSEGTWTEAKAENSHAEGYRTNAAGQHSHAEGHTTEAKYCAHSEGGNTKAYGYYSHAEGNNTQANASSSHAEGNGTQANGNYSHAEGQNNIALSPASHTEGKNNISGAIGKGYYFAAVGVYDETFGDTISENEAVLVLTKNQTQPFISAYTQEESWFRIYTDDVLLSTQEMSEVISNWSGKEICIITPDKTYIKCGEVIGEINASGVMFSKEDFENGNYDNYQEVNCSALRIKITDITMSLDKDIIKNDDYVIFCLGSNIGSVQVTKTTETVHTEGQNNIAMGNYSHAEGLETLAEGKSSHTEGYKTKALNENSHAEGYNTKAIGRHSHAEGHTTEAKYSSHAEGGETKAYGYYSHAEGYGVKALSKFSHAEGCGTNALGESSHAEGNNSVSGLSDVKGFYLSSISNRSDDIAWITLNSDEVNPELLWLEYVNGIYESQSIADGGNATEKAKSWQGKQICMLTTNNKYLFCATVYNATAIKYNDRANCREDSVFVLMVNKADNFPVIDMNQPYKVFCPQCADVGDIEIATGIESVATHAEGKNNKAIGNYSHAEGNNTQAYGEASHAEGLNTKAEATASHAEGENNITQGKSSHVEGGNNKTVGDYSHAEGNGTIASGENSHSEGENTKALSKNSHAEGKNNISGINIKGYYIAGIGLVSDGGITTGFEDERIIVLGKQQILPSICNFPVDYDGELLVLDENYPICSSEELDDLVTNWTDNNLWVVTPDNYYKDCAKIIGRTSTYNGYKALHVKINNNFPTAFSIKANNITEYTIFCPESKLCGMDIYTTTETTHTEGINTIAVGNYSHAEGNGTTAQGESSHTEGVLTKAGYAAHAEGHSSEANGYYSHAEGQNCKTSGSCSHAEGNNTIAQGWASHAEGASTQALGVETHSEGCGTIAKGNYQHVQGKYNIIDDNSTYANIVGNGTGEDVLDENGNIIEQNRSNAHTLDWQGNAWYARSLSLGGTSENPGIKLDFDSTHNRLVISFGNN